MENIRGTHTSPGYYDKITDLTYKANSLGITTAGLVGETLKGPAFDPTWITSKQEFADYFGGTSAEKYKDTLYPRYELPYIANSYLSASNQLYVCRVLGLSGYNAGPAFVITAKGSSTADTKEYVIAVLRSRGEFNKNGTAGDSCDGNRGSNYDKINFECQDIQILPYTSAKLNTVGCDSTAITETDTASTAVTISSTNLGRFTLKCTLIGNTSANPRVEYYPVSLNAGDKDYIYKVLGGTPTDGSAAVFVEEFYDNYLLDLLANGLVSKIEYSKTGSTSTYLEKFKELEIKSVAEPVKDFISVMPEENLTRKNLNETYLVDKEVTIGKEKGKAEIGQICKVGYDEDERKYLYEILKKGEGATATTITVDTITAVTGNEALEEVKAVKVLSQNAFYCFDKGKKKLIPVEDISDYHEMYRCATTPWVVSDLMGIGSGTTEMKKLFRFHTISDGNCANREVKISIANIKPDEGTFDVYVRDYNDSDANPTILESYRGLNMVPGNSKYIGMKIGTIDGAYECKSKYIMAEIIENDMTEQCVPAGFLGYPVRTYGTLVSPSFKYNTRYDENIKAKRQYFGLSDITGVDYDMLSYKGKYAYTEKYSSGYTHGFHLNSYLSSTGLTIKVDGETVIGFDTVSASQKAIFGTEAEMVGGLYEDVNLRKFTLYPCGGFDGWDIYRKSRTTADEFRANKYKGAIVNGHGSTFSKIQGEGVGLGLTGNCITSDYYAWLAGVRQFGNPEQFQINMLATPGIDYVNDTLLSSDILDLVEDRKDTLYVMTTPDKPKGATDAIDEMYSSADAASNLEDAGIDSYYAATYYPWVKYYDKENSVYINLPATKDALRSMANVDNKKFPWYAPAGVERGKVDCVKMHFFAKLEDEDNVYSGRINTLKTFSKEGVLLWGNKTMYSQETPMNRINTVRLMLYLRRIIKESVIGLIFEPNDTTLKGEFERIVKSVLSDVKSKRGFTDFKLQTSQTAEQMDAHELSGKLWVKPTPTLEYIELEFMVTPQGVDFED